MKIAVIGANGQLGSDLCRVFSQQHEVIPLTHSDIQIENMDSVKLVLSPLLPDVILNTAAFHVVPVCEGKPDTAYNINPIGSLNLARFAQDIKSEYVYYSTDYVFDGSKHQPYLENDSPNPLNIYAVTKLDGEFFALNYCERSIVARVSGIYGKTPCRAKGGNFITTMIKLAKEKPEVNVVADEILTPTPAFEIAKTTLELINRKEEYGLFHMTSEGECSWYDFAKEIFDKLKLKTPLYSCSVKDFTNSIKRPFYSVLENFNLKKIKIDKMSYWKDGLDKFLEEYYL